MFLQRNDPFAGLLDLHSQIDEMFNNFANPLPEQDLPALDLYSDDGKNVVAELQIPGYSKDEIEVNAHNGMLEIKGSKKEKEEKNKKREYMIRESHASFYRSVSLPKTADADKAVADFSNGLLTVKIPLKGLVKSTKINISESTPKKK